MVNQNAIEAEFQEKVEEARAFSTLALSFKKRSNTTAVSLLVLIDRWMLASSYERGAPRADFTRTLPSFASHKGSYILSRRLVPIFAHFLVENNHTAALKPILQANLRKQQRAILR